MHWPSGGRSSSFNRTRHLPTRHSNSLKKRAATSPRGGMVWAGRRCALLMLSVALWAAWTAALAYGSAADTFAQPIASSSVRFAVIGDFGSDGQPPVDVGKLVAGWNPDLVITVGD